MRHFVMPWMGLEEFRRMIDQMAKLKFNYLEFYWYGRAVDRVFAPGREATDRPALHQGFRLSHLAPYGGLTHGQGRKDRSGPFQAPAGLCAGIPACAEPGTGIPSGPSVAHPGHRLCPPAEDPDLAGQGRLPERPAESGQTQPAGNRQHVSEGHSCRRAIRWERRFGRPQSPA